MASFSSEEHAVLIRTAMENPSLRRVLVASLLRVAPGAFALKALVNLLNSLWSKKKSHADGSTTATATKPQQQQQQHHPASFIARLNVPDAAKFAAFIGGLSAAAPLFERLVWRILASPILLDPQAKSASVFRRALLASIVGGGISGAALLLDDESRRPAIALYALVNAMDVLFRSALIKKWLPFLPRVTDTRRLSYVYVVCMCFIASWTLFAHGYHYTTFFRPYQRFLAKYGNVSEEHSRTFGLDCAECERTNTYSNKWCQRLHPGISCWMWVPTCWSRTFSNSVLFYGSVHSIGLLFSGLKRPLAGLKTYLANVGWSSAFLATYVTTVHIVWCLARQLRNREHPSHLFLGGFLSGFALLLEYPERRSELAMYCAPQVFKSMFEWAHKFHYVGRYRHAEVLLFAIAASVTFTATRHQPLALRPSLRKLLTVLWARNK